MLMHERRIQRTLIAFLKREAPLEWTAQRAELRRTFAELLAGLPSDSARRDFGWLYAQRKAALVIAMARHISTRD